MTLKLPEYADLPRGECPMCEHHLGSHYTMVRLQPNYRFYYEACACNLLCHVVGGQIASCGCDYTLDVLHDP